MNTSQDLKPEDLLVDIETGDFGEDVREDDFSFGRPVKNVHYMRHPVLNGMEPPLG